MDDIRNGLLSFYGKRHSSDGDVRIVHLAHISDGWENEVYSFRIEQGKAGKQSREDLILRIYPGDGASQKAEKEFNGMKKLYELGFPVPEVLILELDDSYFGKPFVIMEKIDGRPMGKVMEESSEERRQELGNLFCQMFVDLHALDWRPFAPDPSVYETGGTYMLVDEFLSMGKEYIDRFGMDEFVPIMDWLRERRLSVPCERPSVIHLDYHAHNILLREDGKAFVIDWTNIGVADLRMDIAWTIVLTSNYGDPEARQFILDEYERLAGHKVKQIEYFEVIACFRRLFSMIVSINQGAEKMGMRPEAVMRMKQNVGHMRNVYDFMLDRTGIPIPEIETLISTLSEN